jgi:iron complex outermembrane receptor protein
MLKTSAAGICGLLICGAVHAQTQPAVEQVGDSAESATTGTDPSPAAPAERGEIIVTGIRASVEDSLRTKRQSSSILDSISAQDIGKLPDQNVSETLSRVPGVQITRQEGEGARINVRGIDLNKVLINGRSFVGASTNGDPNLSDFPAEILASVDVIKSASADLPEGWLGAIINLKTRRPLDQGRRVLAGRLQANYADNADEFGGKASATVSTKLFNDRLGLLLTGSASRFSGRSDGFWTRGYTRVQNVPVSGPGASAPFLFRPTRMEPLIVDYTSERFGLNGTIQWKPNDNIDITVDALHSKADTDRARYINQILLTNALTNAFALEDGTISQATVGGVTIRPIINDSPSTNTTKGLAGSFTYDNSRFRAQLNVSANRGVGDSTNDSNAQEATASRGASFIPVTRQIAGNTASISYQNTAGLLPHGYNVSANYDVNDPNQYETFTIVDQFRFNRNSGRDADLSLRYITNWGPLSAIKVGARYERVKVFDILNGITYSNAKLQAGDPTPANSLRATETAGLIYSGSYTDFLNGVGGAFPRTILSGSFDVARFRERFNGVPTASDLATALSTQADVEQTTKAFFGMAEFEGNLFDMPFTGNAGVRYVVSDRESFGYDLVNGTALPRTDGASFKNALPSVNFSLRPIDSVTLRLAAAKVIARPELSLTSVGINFNTTIGTARQGNPQLEPFRATQYDASAEWYFAPASMLSAAFFYKDVAAFTRTVQTLEDFPGVTAPGLTNTLYLVSRPQNGSNGSIKGVELNYFHAFSFLPAPFDGLGLNVSFTRAVGKTPNVDELTAKTLSLPNLSKTSYNIIGYYEKGPVNFRLAYNYRSDFLLAQQSAVLGGSLYHNGQGQLDASGSWKLNEILTLNLDAINLTKSPRKLYVGTENRLTTLWLDDRRIFVGLSARF